MLPFEVPFMTPNDLDDAATALLHRYSEWKGAPARPPIDVDEIVEGLLGLDLEVTDLRGLLGMGDVLGATWLDEGRICIDESLEGLVGRFAFTVAHELGHWELHRPLFLHHRATMTLFPLRPGDPPTPAIICRGNEGKAPEERQADQFAARLIMPASDVRSAMQPLRGDLPVALDRLEAGRKAGELSTALRDLAGQVIIEGKFTNVSNEAMCYRLLDLKLVADSAQSTLPLF